MNLMSRAVAKIREINRRYATPKIRLSRSARISLLALRLYLLLLVALLLYRLIVSL